MRDDAKYYQIPRKVNEGIRFFGLNLKEMMLMLPPVTVTFFLWFATDLSATGKIMITIAMNGLMYGMITSELGNGLRALEYVQLLIKYYAFDQNAYHLTSSKSRNAEDQPKLLQVKKAEAQPQEIFVSEWDDNNEPDAVDPDKEKADLDELAEWIAKPKDLSNHRKEVG